MLPPAGPDPPCQTDPPNPRLDGAAGPWDVLIVGAGPAGSVAAFHLAQAGRRVALVERARFPRYKPCGGGLIGRVLDLCPVPLEPVIEHSCRRARVTLWHSGRSFDVERPGPIVAMTRRSRLDAYLLAAAVRAGASLISPVAVTALGHAPEGGAVRARTDRGDINAAFAIDASGAVGLAPGDGAREWSSKHHGVPGLPALECEIRVDRDTWRHFSSVAHFDFDVVPHGYAWVFPKRGHLSVGMLTREPKTTSLPRAFHDYLRRREIEPLAIERHGFVIPWRPSPPLAVGRILRVGDAAGLANPITLEGISGAMASGTLAADAIVNADRPDRVASAYVTALSRQVLRHRRWANRLATLLYSSPRARGALFRVGGQALCEAMTDLLTGGGPVGQKSLHRDPKTV